jgi:Tfp pilus assembly protein PilN
VVQLNLIPDVKAEYMRAIKLKRMIFGISFIVIAVSFGLVVLLFSYSNGIQKLQLSNQQEDIDKYSKELAAIPDLDKILTIQNQLNSLDPLHADRPVASRLYTYIPQITPPNVFLTRFGIDFDPAVATIEIRGTATTQEDVNRFVDTLKFTKYTKGGSDEQMNAFSEVVLANFDASDRGSTFNVTLKYNPELFNGELDNVLLVVPSQITTRSTTERPNTTLFNAEQPAEATQ